MKTVPAKRITKWDIAVIACVAALIIFLFAFFSSRSEYRSAEVRTADGSFEISLSEDCEKKITSNGYEFVLQIKDGEIFVKESDCPDGVCRATSPIGKRRGSILCVPAEMIITVDEGGSDNENADIIIP